MNTENAVSMIPNYAGRREFEALDTEENTNKPDNPNQTWVTQKITWVVLAWT